jgi:hypothetical protein
VNQELINPDLSMENAQWPQNRPAYEIYYEALRQLLYLMGKKT